MFNSVNNKYSLSQYEQTPKFIDTRNNNDYEDTNIFSSDSVGNDKSDILEAEDKNSFDEMYDFVMHYKDVYTGTFKGTDGIGDFASKQNHIAGQVIAGIMTGNGFPSVDELDEINKSWDTIKDKDEFALIENDLSDEDNQKARDKVIQMLEEELEFTKSEIPEYGDCKDYYNNGNLTDWLVSHPVGITLDKIAEATDWEGYQNIKENYLSKDGMFTFQNIPGYIWGKDGEDDITDMLTIKSTDTIIKEVENREALLEKLKANKDNPEEFAKIYYEMTNGINFDAEKVLNYSEDSENADGSNPTKTEIIGRNFIYEDIGKNRLGTDIMFEINKTVGTGLCKMIPVPVLNSIIAGVVNCGVSILDNETVGENETKQSTGAIIVKELMRTVGVLGGSKIKAFISKKTNVNSSYVLNGMFSSGKTVTTDIAVDITNLGSSAKALLTGKPVDWGSTAASAVNVFVFPFKSIGKVIGKSLFNKK